jgi:hypothetical protein
VTESTPQPPDAPPPAPSPPPDDGLRRVLTWTFIALVVTLILAAVGVTLVVYLFDPGA